MDVNELRIIALSQRIAELEQREKELVEKVLYFAHLSLDKL